jgi:hypothetical protein
MELFPWHNRKISAYFSSEKCAALLLTEKSPLILLYARDSIKDKTPYLQVNEVKTLARWVNC